MKNFWKRMEKCFRTILITLAVVMFVGMMAGTFCGCTPQTLRFAPTESQKEAGDATSRLAGGTAITGAKPFGPAGKALAKMAPTIQSYMGTPENPIDIMPILEEEYKEWSTLEKQRDGFKFISTLAMASAQKVTDKLRDLIVRVGESKEQTIRVQDLISTLTALSDSQAIILAAANEYEIPDDWQANADIKELIAKIEGVVESAHLAAARRPTGKDVSQELRNQVQSVNEEAQNWLGIVGGIADEWGVGGALTGLLGAAGIGGVAVRGRGKVKKIVAASDETAKEKDKILVDKDIEISKLEGENASLYEEVRELSRKLAEAPSSLTATP